MEEAGTLGVAEDSEGRGRPGPGQEGLRGSILMINPIFGIRVSLKENLVADALPHRRKDGDLLPLRVGQQQPDLAIHHHIEVLQAIKENKCTSPYCFPSCIIMSPLIGLMR